MWDGPVVPQEAAIPGPCRHSAGGQVFKQVHNTLQRPPGRWPPWSRSRPRPVANDLESQAGACPVSTDLD